MTVTEWSVNCRGVPRGVQGIRRITASLESNDDNDRHSVALAQ